MNHAVLRPALSRLLCGPLIYCSLMFVVQPAWALSSQQSLVSAARELSRAPAVTRAAFVEAAVTELGAAYRVAAHQGAEHNKKGQAWSAGAQAYVVGLQRAAAAARAGAPVRLLVDGGHSLRVLVGGRPARQFIVSAPRANGRPALERAILRRLCAMADCAAANPLLASGEPAPTAGRITASTGPAPSARPVPSLPLKPLAPRLVTTLMSGDDGLRCAQDEVRHHVLYDNACKALLGDVRALITALHASARRGVTIDWRMPARPYVQGTDYALAINGRGDAVRLPMAALGEAPALLLDILPWAQGRLFGHFQTLVLHPPARLVYSAAVAQR